jgi:FkbM family methyltransferase
VRLPHGAWWLARNDDAGELILARRFETAEVSFVERFLKPGMTVLDLGAHQGYYTLLASKLVGRQGRVIAFEPSSRERKALRMNKALNFCSNVSIEPFALGNEEKTAELYVAESAHTGCNSLRPPSMPSGESAVRIRIKRLDDWLDSRGLVKVDFIKLDVEGAELSVLQGSERLLGRHPRPVVLVEVQDIRTQPWGYRANEIIQYLCRRGYKWFRLLNDGLLEELDLAPEEFDGNFVAWPQELVSQAERFQ